jgi:hypothetical protein
LAWGVGGGIKNLNVVRVGHFHLLTETEIVEFARSKARLQHIDIPSLEPHDREKERRIACHLMAADSDTDSIWNYSIDSLSNVAAE